MLGTLAGAALGAAASDVLTAMGTGIAVASTAAKIMSAAAISKVGGVAAGSMVAPMQSAGVGVSTSSNMILYANGEPVAVLL